MRRSMLRKSSYGSSYPLANIISEYKFENNVLDTVGTNNGTATAITYVTGLVNKAADFNGSTSIVEIPDSASLDFSNNKIFSFSGLVYLDQSAGVSADIIVEKFDIGSSQYEMIIFYRFDSQKFRIQLYGDKSTNATNRIGVETTATFTTTGWKHVTYTYDGGTTVSSLKIYVDGVLQALTTTFSETFVSIENSTAQVTIGGRRNGAVTNSWNGPLDCFRFWDKELTQVETTAIATAELAGTDINP